jgi:hypothetical protein
MATSKKKPSVNNARESVRWYTRIIKNLNMKEIRKEGIGDVVSGPHMGKMCCFYYDPKLKRELPYYDRFPLVIPLDPKPDGFLGLNLHYLPPAARQVLFEQLFAVRARRDLTQENQILMTYAVLKHTTKFPGWKDCIKRYLANHYRSKIIEIDPMSWKLCVALPTSQFQKGSPY